MLDFIIKYDSIVFTTIAFFIVALGIAYIKQIAGYFEAYFTSYVLVTSAIFTTILLEKLFTFLFYIYIKTTL